MKKGLKITMYIIGIIVLLIGIDLGSIFLRNKPIIAVKNDCDCLDQVYKGLLYDTYNCWEYSSPQIKSKWSNFSCTENIIIGKITDIKNDYIIINGVSDNNYLKSNQEAHITLTNNPKILGANNLIVGQYIKFIPFSIKEIYPSLMTANEIEIIYEDDINNATES